VRLTPLGMLTSRAWTATSPSRALPRPQVQYVLSDKTGTLTQNVMGWIWASVDGHLYGKSRSASHR
jgi:magnesium-transporting ATPase (P-type)